MAPVLPGRTSHRSAFGVAIGLLIATSVACSGPSPGHASTPTSQEARASATSPAGHIIFTRAGGTFGDETIFAADADGRHEQRISDFGATCCPRISRDASTVLEAAASPDNRGTTALTDGKGNNRRLLPLPPGTINLVGSAWSPDGSRLAADGWDDKHPAQNGMYLENRDGSHIERLTHAITGGHDIPADFSPDGKQIAFLRTTPDAQRPEGDIYVVDLQTRQAHRVDSSGRHVWYTVRWSPDGQWLAFATKPTVPDVALTVVHPDGSGLRAVFTDPSHRSVITPTWSPDGTTLMFGLARATGDEHADDDLDILDVGSTTPKTVITGNDFKRLPDWVP